MTDHQDPVGSQHGRFAPEQIHAPEAVCHVAHERQPGGAPGVPSRQVVMGENPSYHVFVNWDVKHHGDLLSDSRTAPIGITLLHFDDRMNEYRVARRPCGRPALSELGVKVSLHPAQALRTPL